MFLKTHKTGSTTVQNVLLRYTDNANLTLAVPVHGKFGYLNHFSHKNIRNYKNGKSYDIIAHHLRFNPEELKKVLKHNDTFYFSILRNPVTQMESSFAYFKQKYPAFSSAKSLEDFLNNARKYHNARHPKNSRVKNPTWFDFGYNNRDNCSEQQYTTALREIERSMGFVTAAPCSPKRHVMFLKTHKTGSTTVQNVLLRYTDNANLTLAVPVHGKFGYLNHFSHKNIRNYKNGKSYDIIAHHLRFNPEELKKVLKHNDTLYFSILRNPVTQMESSFAYFKQKYPAFNSSKSLEDFLNNARKYHNTSHPKNSRVKNPTWFDFGYNNRQNFSEEQYTKALKEIERSFNLILIAEYFDESMILLKEFLCWDIDDVVTFKHNSRNEMDIKTVNEETARKIKEWNSLDWKMYIHFNVTFWKKIEETIGLARLKDELAILREKRGRLEKQCSQDGLIGCCYDPLHSTWSVVAVQWRSVVFGEGFNYQTPYDKKSMDFPTAPPCSPKRHVMFLKTHKTGGSTVQNVMLRYIDKANLTLAVPQEHRVTFVDSNYFSPIYIRNYKAGKTYDVITHHLRFNPKELKKVLKHNDTFYFSILRNPVTQMESSFSFFKKDFPAFSSAKSLEDFLNNASEYHNARHPKNSRVKNPTWFDFGYNNRDNCSEEQYTKALREIE
ncbi:hypothetical protein JZ751_028292, partial [Albula glossodonta]